MLSSLLNDKMINNQLRVQQQLWACFIWPSTASDIIEHFNFYILTSFYWDVIHMHNIHLSKVHGQWQLITKLRSHLDQHWFQSIPPPQREALYFPAVTPASPPFSSWKPPMYFVSMDMSAPYISQKRNHMWNVVSGFFHITQYFQGSCLWQHVAAFQFFSRLSNIPILDIQ